MQPPLRLPLAAVALVWVVTSPLPIISGTGVNYYLLMSREKTLRLHKHFKINVIMEFFRVKGLTIKPVRAARGIGRGGAKRNPCRWTSSHQLTPLGVTDCESMAAAPMGLERVFSTDSGVH